VTSATHPYHHGDLPNALRNAAADRLYPKLKLTPPTIHELADHIAEFSLAGILSVRRNRRAGQKVEGAR